MSKTSRKSIQKPSDTQSGVVKKQSKLANQPQPLHPLLQLQQTTGNQAVGQVIQTKLTVGQSGDHYEQEADQIATEVANPTTPTVDNSVQSSTAKSTQLQSSITPVIQTAASSDSSSEASGNLESQLNQTQGSGSPLPEEQRTDMESRIGADFSRVRVHTDDQAAQMNRALNAEAFTHREDIYFDSGRFNPTSSPGKQLLAHELTHVVQQTGGKSRKAAGSTQPLIQRQDKPKATPPDHTAKINEVVKKYNDRLKPSVPLDPKWVQAMMMVETRDATSDARKFDPLQVANQGDPAFKALKSGAEHTDLLTTKEFREELKKKKQTPQKGGKWDYSALEADERMDATTGIEAAVAWLFSKAAQAIEATEETGEELEHTVAKGDTFGKLAPKLGTTVETLIKYNKIKPDKLKIGDKLKYKKAKKKWEISSWKKWEEAIKAYNGGGDPKYFEKVKKEYDKL